LSEASELIHTLCRTWPLEDLLFGSPDETRVQDADILRLDQARASESRTRNVTPVEVLPVEARERRAA